MESGSRTLHTRTVQHSTESVRVSGEKGRKLQSFFFFLFFFICHFRDVAEVAIIHKKVWPYFGYKKKRK
jgi:hypothetical protein